jgi:hypothetical protein
MAAENSYDGPMDPAEVHIDQADESEPVVSWPDALVDRLQVEYTATLPVSAAEAAGPFCASLVARGLLRKPPRAGRLLGTNHTLGPVEVELEGGRALLVLTGKIRLAKTRTGRLQIQSSSHVVTNLLRPLRCIVASPLPIPAGGSDSLLAAYSRDEYPNLLGLQLHAVEGLVDVLVGVVADAANVGVETLRGRAWTQSVEFIRDYRHHAPQPSSVP